MNSRLRNLVLGTVLSALTVSTNIAFSADETGITENEIKLGATGPFSGPAAAFGPFLKSMGGYFKKANESGELKRKINFITYDDAYNPAKTVEQIRKLVDEDHVAAVVGMVGTANSMAARPVLSQAKVPQLFCTSPLAKFNDPKEFPYTMGWKFSGETEATFYAQYILKEHPKAKIGVIYQNDDAGKAFITGLREALGANADKMIVSEQKYDARDPVVKSQILNIKNAGADLLMNFATPKAAAQVIQVNASMGWTPVHIINTYANSVKAVLQPAGLANAKGLVSGFFMKDPADPAWKKDKGTMEYLEWMKKYYPDGEPMDTINVAGYSLAQLVVHVLKNAEEPMTRESILKSASHVKDFNSPMLLPGVKVTITPDDYRPLTQIQLAKFDGERWVRFGKVLEARGTQAKK